MTDENIEFGPYRTITTPEDGDVSLVIDGEQLSDPHLLIVTDDETEHLTDGSGYEETHRVISLQAHFTVDDEGTDDE